MIGTLPRLGAAVAVAAFAATAAPSFAQNAAPARPDLNGIWGGGVAQLAPTTCQKKVDAFANEGDARFTAGGAKAAAQWITFEQDCGIQHRGRFSKPLYKPEYWTRVRMNDYYANAGGQFEEYADPVWLNWPQGVPRLGPPNQIVQVGDQAFFLYENQNQFRTVPLDCREHDPVLKYDQTFNGLSVGCWQGDTLVVTSMGFTDKSWLDWVGYLHSNEMVVIERFKRDGDNLTYDVTVEDPVTMLEPWKMDTLRLTRNRAPGAQLMQDVPYIEKSLGKLTDPNYRG
jgi:hypothetical protein